jgi:hypothetical protein
MIVGPFYFFRYKLEMIGHHLRGPPADTHGLAKVAATIIGKHAVASTYT